MLISRGCSWASMKRGGSKFEGSKTGAVLISKRRAVVSQLVPKFSAPPPPPDQDSGETVYNSRSPHSIPGLFSLTPPKGRFHSSPHCLNVFEWHIIPYAFNAIQECS